MNPAALATLIGARVDGFFAHLPSGAIALSTYAGARRVLGIGIGPSVVGIGWLPRVPNARTPSSHPLVAAARAHVVDHRVRDASIDDEGRIWVVVGGESAITRIAFVPGPKGEVRIVGPEGRPVLRWPPEPSPIEATLWQDDADGESSGAALAAAWEETSFRSERAAWLRGAMRKRSQLARRRDAVREDLARVEAVPRLQKVGRLLLAQSSRIAKGAVRALLDDWEEGGQIEIVLDPSRSAKSHAEDCFAKARRLQRGEPFMRRRLDETERLLERAETVRAAIEAAHETAALGEAVREAERFGIRPGETGPNRAARAERASRKPFTRYRGVRERAILVGRGGADNDALTTRHARPHDLWLHAKNIAGAHVIVPLEKGTTCPPDLLVDAATLAGHFSDARGEGVVEVSYVERRYVRKPRGSAPGAVTFDHEKVIAVRMDAGRVERLLATRED